MSFGAWWHDLPLPLKVLGIGAGAAGAFFGAPAAAGALGMGGAASGTGAGAAAGGVGPLALGGSTGFGATAVPGLATSFQAMGGAPLLAGQYAAAPASTGFLGSLGAFASKHPTMTNYAKGMGQDWLQQYLGKSQAQPQQPYNPPGDWKSYAGRDTLGEMLAQMRQNYSRPMWTQREQG